MSKTIQNIIGSLTVLLTIGALVFAVKSMAFMPLFTPLERAERQARIEARDLAREARIVAKLRARAERIKTERAEREARREARRAEREARRAQA